MSSTVPVELMESDAFSSESVDKIPLNPSKVRWFYKDETSKRWIPFSGYDSIKIESNYLRLLKRQPMHLIETEDDIRPLVVRGGLYEVDVATKRCYPIYWESPTGSTDMLRGIWFKDPTGPNPTPIEDEFMVQQLEITYAILYHRTSGTGSTRSGSVSPKLDTDENSGADTTATIGSIFSSPVKQVCVRTLKFTDCHVDWYSPDELYLYVEGASFYIRQKLGLQKVGTRLGRGYFEEADLSSPPPVYSHLVFVVHGMGQKYLKGSIITACDGIRETSMKLIESYFPDLRDSERRVQFLPVEWRNSLRLDGNIVDSITLDNIPRLRTLLNYTFMDIMYYTSPLYRYEINQSLRLELNRLYWLFCERHPYFESSGGKVSILAHSLGCVISYDLITGWIEPAPSNLPAPFKNFSNATMRSNTTCEFDQNGDSSVLLAKLEAAKEVVKCLETQLESRKLSGYINGPSNSSHSLLFASRLENLFCMGSPLAVYLTLRGVRPGQTGAPDAIMPRSKCSHIYNIFHPADPVAYRLEPLLLKHYSSIPPVNIYRCTDVSKYPFHVMHALSIASPNSSPPPQHRSVSGVFYTDQNTTNEPSSARYSLPMLGQGSASVESLNSIGSRFSRHLPLSSFMFGFFGRSSESEAAHPTSQRQLSAKRLKPSSPVSESMRAQFLVGSEEELVNLDDEVIGFSTPSSPETEASSKICLEYRMDYQLKESRYEAAYLSALTVHTGYWVNTDVVMFVLMQCHPDSTPLDTPLTL